MTTPSTYRHNRCQSFAQLLKCKSISNHALEAVLAKLRHHWILRVAAGHDRLHRGIERTELLHRLLAAHTAGDDQVQNHGIVRPAVLLRGSVSFECCVTGVDDFGVEPE